MMRGVNAEHYVLRWSPRRPKGNWTETNRARARRLAAEGRMTAAGFAALPPELRAELEPSRPNGEKADQNSRSRRQRA